jgi:hypothetical protein
MKGRLKGSPSRVGFATPLAQRVSNALDCENPGIVSSAAAVLDDWRIPGARPMGYSRFNGLNVRWDRASRLSERSDRKRLAGTDVCWIRLRKAFLRRPAGASQARDYGGQDGATRLQPGMRRPFRLRPKPL